MAEDTLTRWLARHVRERPEARAVLYQDQVWTWSGLAGEVARISRGLAARGIGRGDVVAVQLPNTPEFVFSYLAIAQLGVDYFTSIPLAMAATAVAGIALERLAVRPLRGRPFFTVFLSTFAASMWR